MEEINTADSIGRDVTDISGVKDEPISRPEGDTGSVLRDADGAEIQADGSENTDISGLEAEFDELVRGRFKEVYKKRTEGIIRKRLRSVKARSERGENAELPITGAMDEDKALPSATVPDDLSAPSPTEKDALGDQLAALEDAKAKNRSRPIENGLGGSCGVVTKINVSALSGRDVISILRRVGSGERISFK